MNRIIAVIPARMASTRFPGKPLAELLGLPMIEHVRRRSALAPSISEVVVATCDREVGAVVTANGGRVIYTSTAHERCTDRVAEAARQLEAQIIVNVQGDEPCVSPEMLEAVVRPLVNDPALECVNLAAPLTTEEEWMSVNVVKVVARPGGEILYFSRAPIPSSISSAHPACRRLKQLGVVAFRAAFLQTFARLEPTPLERLESVDMLRAVEHGYRVQMVEAQGTMIGVDVPVDVPRAERWLASDPLLRRYLAPVVASRRPR